mgnify:FL=1
MRDMTKIIENIVTKEPTPDEKYTPKIILHWSTKTEGQIYHDLSTGKRLTYDESEAFLKWENLSSLYLQYSAGATPRLTYIKYHRRQNVMELAYVNIPMNRAKPGEIRTFKYNKNWSGNTERYFVDLSQYPRRLFLSDGSHASMEAVKDILRDTSMHRRAQIYNELFPDDKIEYANFSWIQIDYVTKYLTYQRQLTINTSKTAKAVLITKGNDLLSQAPTVFPDKTLNVGMVRNFPGISIVDAKAKWGQAMRFYYDGKNFAAAKAPNYDVSCAYSSLKDVTIYNPEDLKDGMFKKYAGLFAKPVIKQTSWYGDRYYYCENPEETKFSTLKALATIVKNPMYEQLAKSYKGIQLINTLDPCCQTEIFGSDLNQKATTVDKWLGLNKYQLGRLISAQYTNDYYTYRTKIATFRKIVGPNAASLDNQTTDIYINNLRELRDLTENIYNTPETTAWINQMLPKVIKHPQVTHNINLLLDTLRTWRSLNWPRPELPVVAVSELHRLHDLYTRLLNEQQQQRQAMYAEEARQRAERIQKENKPKLEFRGQLNYDDENYLIRLPKDEDEICKEGMSLHHCVGGYAHEHSIGSTTIMFLRKKSEPDKPFYTIEVEIGVVDGKVAGLRIRQTHGFGNKWLGNDPEAIPTVVRWLRKHNIECNEGILTSVSTQYSIGNKFIKMPEVV